MSNSGLEQYRALFPGMMSWQTRSDGSGRINQRIFVRPRNRAYLDCSSSFGEMNSRGVAPFIRARGPVRLNIGGCQQIRNKAGSNGPRPRPRWDSLGSIPSDARVAMRRSSCDHASKGGLPTNSPNQNWLNCAIVPPRSGKRRITFRAVNKPIVQKSTIVIRLGSTKGALTS
jgi:hypothetical protein